MSTSNPLLQAGRPALRHLPTNTRAMYKSAYQLVRILGRNAATPAQTLMQLTAHDGMYSEIAFNALMHFGHKSAKVTATRVLNLKAFVGRDRNDPDSHITPRLYEYMRRALLDMIYNHVQRQR